MPCTEAYREHIMYTFNGYCKTVIRFAAITAWRDRSRRRQKKYPLNTSQGYIIKSAKNIICRKVIKKEIGG